jgi:hypothetical protein
MENLVSSEESKNFYVWVPANFSSNMVGAFVSVANKEDNLMFLPNSNFSGYISPFQTNILRSYSAEYHLEMFRKKNHPQYPSRLIATFLFENEEDALQYKETHSFHVGNRKLKIGKTVGPYTYSKHDLAWIDFLQSPIPIEKEIRNKMIAEYWIGKSSKEFKIKLSENSLTVKGEQNFEILLIGRLDF